MIIMGFLIHRCCKKAETLQQHNGSQILQQFRNAIALSLLFGIGWALGLPATEGISSVAVRTAFQVSFIVVTAFQGLYIFILQCLTGRNAVEAKKEWKRWFALITFGPNHVQTYTVSRASVSTSREVGGKEKVLVQGETLMSLTTLPSPTMEPSTTALEMGVISRERVNKFLNMLSKKLIHWCIFYLQQ